MSVKHLAQCLAHDKKYTIKPIILDLEIRTNAQKKKKRRKKAGVEVGYVSIN